MQPLGSPVVPLVYSSMNRDSPLTDGSSASAGLAAAGECAEVGPAGPRRALQDPQLNRRVAVQRGLGERRQLAAGEAGARAGILDERESQLRRGMPDVQRH